MSETPPDLEAVAEMIAFRVRRTCGAGHGHHAAVKAIILAALREAREANRRRIEELKAAIGNIPRTKDRVAVIPGLSLVYHPIYGALGGEMTEWTAPGGEWDQWCVAVRTTEGNHYMNVPVSSCYSTAEAVLAAGEEPPDLDSPGRALHKVAAKMGIHVHSVRIAEPDARPSAHKHVFTSDGGPCHICRATVAELLDAQGEEDDHARL